jgi:hypothetical protein
MSGTRCRSSSSRSRWINQIPNSKLAEYNHKEALNRNAYMELERIIVGTVVGALEKATRYWRSRGWPKLSRQDRDNRDRSSMLWTIAIILLVLWLLGFSFHVAGGLIHIILVIALIVIVFRLVTGRAP